MSLNIPVKNLSRLFLERSKQSAKSNAIGTIINNKVNFITFEDYRKNVEILSLALVKLGLKKQDKVAIISKTRPEWNYFDLAILSSGAITVPVYHSYSSKDTSYILDHSETCIAIVENNYQFEKIANNVETLKKLKYIISLEKIEEANLKKIRNHISYYTYKELLHIGSDELTNNPGLFEEKIKHSSEEEIATIIYTSGATARPKGAVITHKALVQMLINVKEFVGHNFKRSDRTLTFLPLSLAFGRSDSYMPIIFGLECVYARTGVSLLDDIKIVKPTIMCSVPYFFEELYKNSLQGFSKKSYLKKNTFSHIEHFSKNFFDTLNNCKTPSLYQIAKMKIIQNIIFKDIHKKLGGNIRYFITGGASVNTNVLNFFQMAGITILEGYGLTETVAPCCLNPPAKQIIGTVGKPLGDVEIDFMNDGEILISSDALFTEYYKDKEQTKNSFTKDGAFKSGDIGHFNQHGHLVITGRKKDIITTTSGEKILPKKLKEKFCQSELIDFFIPLGEKQDFLVAIVALKEETLKTFQKNNQMMKTLPFTEIAKSSQLKSAVRQEIMKINSTLSKNEQIRDFILVDEAITIHNYLTPSLKIRKSKVLNTYKDKVNALF